MKANQKRVLKIIRDQGGVSNASEVRELSGYKNSKVRSITSILERDGYIDIESQAVPIEGQAVNANRYELTDQGENKAEDLGELIAQSEMINEVESLRARVDKQEEVIEDLKKDVSENMARSKENSSSISDIKNVIKALREKGIL